MKTYTSKILALVIGSVLAMILIPARGPFGQKQNATQGTVKNDLRKLLSKQSSLPPVAEFEQAQKEAAKVQLFRQSRDRLSQGLYTRTIIVDPGVHEVNGEAETIDLLFIDGVDIRRPGERPNPVGLPISDSIIVIGKVVSGRSYINQAHTGVFSEYEVVVSEVLKADPESLILPREEINVWRPGGSLQFPSGHITHFIIAGRGFPEIGTQHVLFLRKPDKSVNDYAISTAFSIKDHVIAPLDSRQDQTSFDGMTLDAFLGKLRKELASGYEGGMQ